MRAALEFFTTAAVACAAVACRKTRTNERTKRKKWCGMTTQKLPENPRDWPVELRDAYEERAAILEFSSNFPRLQAEALAKEMVLRMAELFGDE